jgi:glyoxylate reductase
MSAHRLKLVVTRRLPASVEARMAEAFDAELNPADRPFSRDELAAAMARADILAPAVTDRIDADLIAGAGPQLRLIANFGVGVDNIDLAAARARGIAVSNTPGVLTDDTADIVLALILMSLRRLGEGERLVRAGGWTGWGPTDMLGRGLSGKILAIVGMGRIGRAVARRASAFGLVVHYHNRTRLDPAKEEGALYAPDLDQMLAGADIVSVNAPYGPATHHLIEARRLALLKPTAHLINAARGAIVDQEALIAALASGRLAGAGLDVYPNEPHVDPRLVAMRQVVLIPHMGSATEESRTAMGMKVFENALALAEGRPLPDRVV